MQLFLPWPDFAWSAECLDDETLREQRIVVQQIMHHLLIDGGGEVSEEPSLTVWEGYERALLAYQQALCHEWSSVRGHEDEIWDFTRSMFLDIVVDPMATPLIPPPWIGNVDFHISHQSALLRRNEAYYRPQFPGIRNDHAYVWMTVRIDRSQKERTDGS